MCVDADGDTAGTGEVTDHSPACKPFEQEKQRFLGG